MSFLSQLQKQKNKLKEMETVVTKADGHRFVENKDQTVTHLQSNYGFVVDTKPDDIPVLVTDCLYIGSQDCATDSIVENYQIKHVLSLGIDVEVTANKKFIQCLDLPETDVKPVLAEALPFIRECIEAKQNVLVHCNAGVSRTALVAIAYVMHYGEMQFEDAYSLVKNRRPAVQPNDGFRRQLKKMSPGRVI